MEKMYVKDVYKLKAGDKILVHVHDLHQPIKAAGGLCLRFMTTLIKQPNLCSLDAKTFCEVKKYSGADIVKELREKFRLPCNPEVDRVILSKFSSKYRIVKWRFKEKLFNIAKEKIKENRKIEGVYVEDEEKHYTSEQVLEALDIIETAFCFQDHQWQKFKANIRDAQAKDLPRKGKEARKTQVHNHTTSSISYARKKDMIKLEKKRKPTEVKFFKITHQKKNGSYAQKESKELMDKVNEMIKQKMSDLGICGSLDPKLQSEIHSEVWKELMEDENARKPIGYGVGVTKSQVSKLSADLRRIRHDISGTNEVHALRKRVSMQDNQINELRNTANSLVSHFQKSGSASGIYANMIMDPTLFAGIGLPESQGRTVDHDSNNETSMPSPSIPSP